MPFVEKKLTCPYDRNHQILPERMQRHLMLCKRQHPHVNLRICPWNSTHHVTQDKYERHTEICRDRKIVENSDVVVHAYHNHPGGVGGASSVASRPLGPPPPPPARAAAAAAAVANPDEEDWEAEMEGVVPYDPTKNAMSKLVWRTPQTLMTKSERRRFREEEKQRWHSLIAEGADKETGEDKQVVPEEGGAKPSLRRPVSVGPMANQTPSAVTTRDSGAAVSSFREPRGIGAPPPPPTAVKSIGRGRGTAPAGPPPVGLRRPKPWTGSSAATGSETGTFETTDFKSLDDSIISGNLRAMRMQ